MSIEVIAWDGQPISRAGVYSGIPLPTYHQQLTVSPSGSSSLFRKMEDSSPAHAFIDCYLNPEFEPKASSEALVMGSAVHHLFTGEADFRRHFWVKPETYPAADGTEKKWTAAAKYCANEEAEAELRGQQILKADSMQHIGGMARALAKHPAIQEGLLNGLVEHSLVWKDVVTGVWLKSRPDNIPLDSAVGADLKTTLSAHPRDVQRSFTDLGYYIQIALVYEGLKQVCDITLSDFFLIFIEKTPPYAVSVRQVDWVAIEYGRRQLRRAINRFADCLERGHWPAYEEAEEIPLALSGYKAKQLFDEAEAKTLPGFYDKPFRPAEHQYKTVVGAD